MSKKEWLVTNHDVNIFPLCVLGKVLHFDLKKVYGFNLPYSFAEFKGTVNRWATTYHEHDKNVPLMIKKVLNNKKWTLNIINKIQLYSQELISFCKSFANKDLSSLTKKELLNLYNLYIKKFSQMYVYGWLPNNVEGLQSQFSLELEKIFLSKMKNSQKIGEYFSLLTAPTKSTIREKEKKDFLSLIKKVKSNKTSRDKLINTHWQKYCWITYNYNGPALSKNHFLKKYQKLANVDVKKELKNLEHQQVKTKQDIKLLEKKLNLSQKEKYQFKLARELMFIKDFRKDILYQSYYYFDFVLKEIAKKLHLTTSQVKSFLPHELNQALNKNNYDVNLLNERLKYSVLFYPNSKGNVLVSKQAKEYAKKHACEKKVSGSQKTLKGQTVYKGKVKGKVKIVNSLENQKLFKKDNVLVSKKTNPNLLPSMLKASAIITDSGGVTSHAAIISRELKIPCIIGTKIATQVFKDGDLVEVDAIKGIVRKLK